MAESAPLLRVYRLITYRGFESLSLRQFCGWLVLLLALALPGCSQNESQQIDWQLPLAAPNDPHGASANQMLPEWAAMARGSAELVLLQKNTALSATLQLVSDMDVDFKGMHFRLLGLADGLRLKSGSYIDDKNVHNPAAFVEISRDKRQIYRGWLYQEFPELFGPDMANWKLWLKNVVIEAAVVEPLISDSPLLGQPMGTVSGESMTGTRATEVGEANMRP